MMIAISTLAFKGYTIDEIIQKAHDNNWTIEFSSGIPYNESSIHKYTNANINRLIHNYFPAPKKPFVINLASNNDDIRKRSIDHCIMGLELAKDSGAPFYSAHAGFCIDPNPKELGNKFIFKQLTNRTNYWEIFLNSVSIVLEKAKKLNTYFLIENNVLTKKNHINKINPLFCSEPQECLNLVNSISHPLLGLLLDTGHLKVSSKTLNFDLNQAIKELRPITKAIHHSDNNGIEDSNSLLKDDYWFLKYNNSFANDVLHIIEVKTKSIEEIHKQIRLLSSHLQY